MTFKIFAGSVAAALLIVYVSPVVLKLKEISLALVALAGISMMLVDLWQALKARED